MTVQSMRFGAEALRRAETLLSSGESAAHEVTLQPEPEGLQTEPGADREPVVPEVSAEATRAVGSRGEWRGNVGRQPEFDRVNDGRIRAVFFLAQHPDPENRELTEWVRCYNLARHAESLQKKGRLAGAEILVRGQLQGVRQITQKDGTVVDQQTIYCYGIRVLKAAKPGPGAAR